jgi:hypothetical protein
MSQIGRGAMVHPESAALTAPSAPRSAVEETYMRHGAALFALAVVLLEDPEDAELLVTRALLDSCTPPDLTSPLLNRRDLARYVYVLWARNRTPPDTAPVHRSRRSRGRKTPRLNVGGRLSQLQRASIALALFGDHTYIEIASLMDLPAGEVADHMRSGLLIVAAIRDP